MGNGLTYALVSLAHFSTHKYMSCYKEKIMMEGKQKKSKGGERDLKNAF